MNITDEVNRLLLNEYGEPSILEGTTRINGVFMRWVVLLDNGISCMHFYTTDLHNHHSFGLYVLRSNEVCSDAFCSNEQNTQNELEQSETILFDFTTGTIPKRVPVQRPHCFSRSYMNHFYERASDLLVNDDLSEEFLAEFRTVLQSLLEFDQVTPEHIRI